MRPTNLGGREKLNQPAGGRHHILLEACQFYNVENGRIIEKMPTAVFWGPISAGRNLVRSGNLKRT
jgi:hypothetical protein